MKFSSFIMKEKTSRLVIEFNVKLTLRAYLLRDNR